mmetsp:Transcript_8627/g.18937  ORF Transcript_8627/g.18937 Transcript_8627/m.18937 type:complete len:204 (+) Transcript_8627:99-710(+)
MATMWQLRGCSADERHGAVGLEGGAVLLGQERDLPDDRELQLRVVHLLDVVAPARGGRDRRGVDDLDGARVGTVAAGHLGVELADGAVDGDVAVLLVHVVRVGAGLVAQPDAVVLHLVRALVEELVDGEQLAAALLGLVELLHEVPEARLGQDLVLGEEAHPVDLGHRVLGRRGRAAHNLVLVHARLQGRVLGESLDHLVGCP